MKLLSHAASPSNKGVMKRTAKSTLIPKNKKLANTSMRSIITAMNIPPVMLSLTASIVCPKNPDQFIICTILFYRPHMKLASANKPRMCQIAPRVKVTTTGRPRATKKLGNALMNPRT